MTVIATLGAVREKRVVMEVDGCGQPLVDELDLSPRPLSSEERGPSASVMMRNN
jgi:hypothetical protein